MTLAVLLRPAIRQLPLRFQPCTRGLKAVNWSPVLLLYRQPRRFSSKSTPAFVKTQKPTSDGHEERPKDDSGPAKEVTVREQRRKDWSIMRKMMEHMWPRDWGVRSRVVLGLGLLVGGKVNGAVNLIAILLNIVRIPSC